MTNFIDKLFTVKKTVFQSYLSSSMTIKAATLEPSKFKNVEFIGSDKDYGEVFKVWDDDINEFMLYFGVKGDEFNK